MDESASADSSRESTDWEKTSAFLEKSPSRWGSLIWVSARPLIASVNHVLGRGAPSLVTSLRRYWSRVDPRAVTVPTESAASNPAETTFFLIGDTGEQDASQYVVSPALSAATRTYDPDFVMIMSDVIYPSGDINDYTDGLYRPYRSDDPSFHVSAPLLALPGNHDWYDGLAGFMYHFVGSDKPPDEVYAPAQDQKSAVSQLSRILWRRPSDPSDETRNRRATARPSGALEQPGPFYAVRTPDLTLVCIDTGIDGTLDERQGAWLRVVSKQTGPKLLVTGKPLVVNEEVQQCPIVPDKPVTGVANLGTVWDIVQDPAHGYVATVGGDVHNFQLYEDPHDTGGPVAHIVAGCGGAFMHATHTVSVGINDSRMRAKPGRQYYAPPTQMFPTRGDSLRLFASLLVPKVRRLVACRR